MKNIYYVYELMDSRTNKPFYIGKGSGTRMFSHLKEAKLPRDKQINRFKCDVINNILSAGHTVIINKIQQDLEECYAYELEQSLIAKYGKRCNGTGILTNISDGGEGGNHQGRIILQHTLSGALIQVYQTLTEAAEILGLHKSTICAALNGRCALAGGARWCYWGETIRPYTDNHKVSVSQFSLMGEVVATFPSIQIAAKITNTQQSSISDCLSGRITTANGFYWALAGEIPKKLHNINYVPAKLRQYIAHTKEGKYVNTFDTLKEAINNTNANETGIVDCCAGRKNSSGGLIWSYGQSSF